MEKQTDLAIIGKYFSDFTETQQAQLAQLGELYADWNQKINVISRKDIESLYERHVLHSLTIAALCNFHDGSRIVDIGTGGGFPGIPLAIFFPQVEFVLVDSIGKKIKVVQAVAEAIGLKNVKAFHSRVEEVNQGNFDFAVSRAVAPLAELWKWIKPFLLKGRNSDEFANGLLCLKGGDLKEEIRVSGLRPHLFPINQIFQEDSFNEKFVVYVPR